jgi:drug/metabolite transporter (DMT)-like permease
MGVSFLLEIFHNHLGELAAVAMAFCATLSVLAWTSTGRRIGVLAVCSLRLTAASLMLAVWEMTMRGHWFPVDADRRTWILLSISGVLGYFLSDFLAIKSFMVIGPRLTLLIQSASPLFVSILGYYWLGESLGMLCMLGMTVTLSGVVWVVLERPASRKETILRRDFLLGIAVALGSAVFGGVGVILAKQGMGDLDPFAATQIRILAALVCYPPLITIMRRWGQIGKALRQFETMKILVYGTIAGPFLGMALFMYALKACPSTGVVCTISSIAPVMILPFCILVYKEKVSPRAAMGAVISVLGIAFMSYRSGTMEPHSSTFSPARAAQASVEAEPESIASIPIEAIHFSQQPRYRLSAGFDNADADFLERGEDRTVGRGIGDQRGPIGQPAELPERGLAQLGTVGDDENAAGRSGHLRQHPRQLGRFLINAAMGVDGVGAQKSRVGPQSLEIGLRERARQIGGRRA